MANWFAQWNQPYYNPNPQQVFVPGPQGGYGPPQPQGYGNQWGPGVYSDAYSGRPPSSYSLIRLMLTVLLI
jgi:hypothetical protein